MLIKSNWNLQFALRIEADEESDIVMLAEAVLERLKNGELDGRGNHYAGVYEFSTIEWATQRKEIEPCTTDEDV